MNPVRPAILIMPFLLPEALPARSPRSKVVIIPPHGHSMMPDVVQKPSRFQAKQSFVSVK